MSELSRDQELEIIVKNLSGLTNLRRFTNTCSFEWLEDLSDKLSTIISEKREEEELRKLELQEVEEKRLKALRFIEELGLDPETINISAFDSTSKSKKKKTRASASPKYRFTNPETGEVETWTGVGRKKKGLEMLLQQGRTLEEFLISNEKAD